MTNIRVTATAIIASIFASCAAIALAVLAVIAFGHIIIGRAP